MAPTTSQRTILTRSTDFSVDDDDHDFSQESATEVGTKKAAKRRVADDLRVFHESTNKLNSFMRDNDQQQAIFKAGDEIEKSTLPTSFSPHLAYLHVLEAMKNEVTIKDRIYHLKTYKDCFLGSDAVGFLQRYLKLSSREQAAEVAVEMNEHVHCWEHIGGDPDLKDQPLFYHFVGDFRMQKGKSQNLASKAAVLFEASLVDHSDSAWDGSGSAIGERAGSFRFGAPDCKGGDLKQVLENDDSWGAFDINNVLACREKKKTQQADGNFDPFQESRVLDGVEGLFDPHAFPAKDGMSNENGQHQEQKLAGETASTRNRNSEHGQGEKSTVSTETTTPKRQRGNSLDSSRTSDESPAANRATHPRSFSKIPRLPGSARDIHKTQKSARNIYKTQQKSSKSRSSDRAGSLSSKPGPLHRSRSAGVARSSKLREGEGGSLSKPGLIRRSRTTGNEGNTLTPTAKRLSQDRRVKKSTKSRKTNNRKPRGRSRAKSTEQSKSGAGQFTRSGSHAKSSSLAKPREEPKTGADHLMNSSKHENWRSLSKPRDVAPSKRLLTLERVSWRRNASRSQCRTGRSASLSPDAHEATGGKSRSNSSRSRGKPVDLLSMNANDLAQPRPMSSKIKTLAPKAG